MKKSQFQKSVIYLVLTTFFLSSCSMPWDEDEAIPKPVANADVITINEDAPKTELNLLGNDTDVTGAELEIETYPTASEGTVEINAEKTIISFTPALNYNQQVQFQYSATTRGGESDPATVTINITPVDDPYTGSATINGIPVEGVAISATNDIADPDGMSSLTYQWLLDGVDIAAATNISYTPLVGDITKTLKVRISYFSGGDTFTTKVESVGKVIGANPTGNVAPEITSTIADQLPELDSTTTILLTNHFSDINGDSLNFSFTGTPPSWISISGNNLVIAPITGSQIVGEQVAIQVRAYDLLLYSPNIDFNVDVVAAATGTSETGTVVTSFIDAPSDDYQQIWIDVDRVSADYTLANDKGETDITQRNIGSIDLLDLRGVAQMFNSMDLKEGFYSNLTVHLKPVIETGKAQIKLLNNDETVSYKSLMSNKIILGGNFEVIIGQRTDIVLDFEVDKWDFLSQTEQNIDPSKLKPAKKDKDFIKDHVKRISLTGTLEDSAGDNSYTFMVEKKRYKIILPTNFVGVLGMSYELEGIYDSETGLITVEEITEKLEQNEYTREKIKISGTVVSIESEDTAGVIKILSMAVKPNRTSIPIKAALATISLEGKIKFKYGKLSDLKEEVKVIVYGEISADGDITPISIIIKGAPKDTEVGIKYFNQERLVYIADGKVRVKPTSADTLTFTDLKMKRVNRNARICLEYNKEIPVRVVGKQKGDNVEVKGIYTEQKCKKPTLENPVEIKFVTGLITAKSCLATEGTEISNHYDLKGSYKVIGGLFNRDLGGKDQVLKGYVSFGHTGKIRSNYGSFFGIGSIKDPKYIINKDQLQIINIAGSTTGNTFTIIPKSGYMELATAKHSLYIQKKKKQTIRMIACDITLDGGSILKTDSKTRWSGNYGTMDAGDKVYATVKDDKTIVIKVKQSKANEKENKTFEDKKNEAGGSDQLRKDVEAKMELEMKKKLEELEGLKETLEKKLEELKKKLKDLEDNQKEKLKDKYLTNDQIKDFIMKEGKEIIKNIESSKPVSEKDLSKLQSKLNKFIKNRAVGELSEESKALLESLKAETTTGLQEYLDSKVRNKEITEAKIIVKDDTYTIKYNEYGVLGKQTQWLRMDILRNDIIPEPISSPRKTGNFSKGDYRVLNRNASVSLDKPEYGKVQSKKYGIGERGLPSSGKWINERYNLTSFYYIAPRQIPTDKDGVRILKEVFEYEIKDRKADTSYEGEITIVFQAPEVKTGVTDKEINRLFITDQYGMNLIDNIKRNTTWIDYQLSYHDKRFLSLANDLIKFIDKKELNLSKNTLKFINDIKASLTLKDKNYEKVIVAYLRTITGLVDTAPFIAQDYKYKTYMAVNGKPLYIKTEGMFLEADKDDKIALYIETRNSGYKREDLQRQYPKTEREFNTRDINIAKEARLIQNNSIILFKPNKLGEFWVMLKAKGGSETMPIRIVVGEKKVEDTKNEDQKEFDKFLVSDGLFRDIRGTFENAKIKPIFVKDIYTDADATKQNQAHRMITDMSIRIYKFIKLQEDKRGGYIVNSIDSASESQMAQDVYDTATRKIYTHIKSTMPSMKNLSVVEVFEYLAKKYSWKYEKPKDSGYSIQKEYDNYLKNDRYIKELGLMIKSYGFLKNEIYVGNPGKDDTRGKKRVVKIALNTIQVFQNRDISGLNSIDVGFVNGLIRSSTEEKLLDTVKIFEYLAKKLDWKYENPTKISKQKQFDNYLNEVKEVRGMNDFFSSKDSSQTRFVKDIYTAISTKNNVAHKEIYRIGNSISAYIMEDRKYEGYDKATVVIFDNISKQKLSKRTAKGIHDDYIKLFEYLAKKYKWKYEKPNYPPTQIVPIGDLTPERKVQLVKDLQYYFNDKDGDKLVFSLKLIEGSPNSGIELSSEGKLSILANNPYTGQYKIEVSDGKSKFLSNLFTIIALNKAPIATKAKPMEIVMEIVGNTPGTLDVSTYFEDPDGDKLKYQLTFSYYSDAQAQITKGMASNDGIFKYNNLPTLSKTLFGKIRVIDEHEATLEHPVRLKAGTPKGPSPITRAELITKITNGDDVTKVNTSQITDMNALFKGNATFNQDISGWDTSKVTNMNELFRDASLFNQDISGWDTSKVAQMQTTFLRATAFNQSIGSWNTSNVLDMYAMFYKAKSFNKPLNDWNVSKVTRMEYMLAYMDKFNQPLDKWDVSSVINFNYLMQNTPFNQDISKWAVRADATKAIWRANTGFTDLCNQLPVLWRDSSCQTTEIKSDPLYDSNAWHINPASTRFKTTNLANQAIGLVQLEDKVLGTGVIVGIIDQGVTIRHPDLIDNMVVNGSMNFVDNSSDTTSTVSENTHGTRVAGITAAVGWNSIGSRGVAPKAKIKSFNFIENPLTSNLIRSIGGATQSKDVGVFNQSFGSGTAKVPYVSTLQVAAYEDGVTNGRGGKGYIYVKSAGNSFELPADYTRTKKDCQKKEWKKHLTCASVAQDGMKNIKEQIIVGALHGGKKASFSTDGAGLWVTAPGTNLPTTTKATEYHLSAAGTSFSAPIVTGVVALMLEANPKLGWRDVKHILAKTSTKVDSNIDPITLKVNGLEHIAVDGWTKNTAGNSFHNYYGFGRVNAKIAVDMAKTGYNLLPPMKMKTSQNIGIGYQLPDNESRAREHSIYMGSGINKIESVTLMLDLNHENLGDVTIEITSPGGTKSIILPVNNNLEGYTNGIRQSARYMTNAFYEEGASGFWKIKVIDTAPLNRGTLNKLQIEISGS